MTRADAAVDEIDFVVGPIRPKAKPTPKPKPKPKPKSGRGLIIGVVVVGVVVLAGAAAVGFRQKLVELVPAAGGLFAAIGLPVNAVGLVFEGVVSKPILVDGRPVMAVAGAIRNVTKAAIDAPPIRISLRDKAKATLIAYQLSITNPRVPPGGVRHFAWNLPDPPAGASGLEIGFAAHGAPAAPAVRAAEAVHATPAAHAAPAPVEAKPLPADSPDALPHHE